MRRAIAALIVPVSLSVAPVSTAGAQGATAPVSAAVSRRGPSLAPALADTALVPRELLVALLGFGRIAPEVVVGRLPAAFAADLVPSGPGIVVLGGITWPDRRVGGGATAVIRTGQPPAAALAAYRTQLGRDGWREPPSDEFSQNTGFVPADARPSVALCRDGASLVVSSAPRQAGGTLMQLTYVPPASGRPSLCAPRPDLAAGIAARVTAMGGSLPMPTLVSPDSALSVGGGNRMSSGSGFTESSTRLSVAMTPAALVAHYAAQMVRAGWTGGTTWSAGGVAGQLFTRPAAGDAPPVQAILTAVAVDAERGREVSLRVIRTDDRPDDQ